MQLRNSHLLIDLHIQYSFSISTHSFTSDYTTHFTYHFCRTRSRISLWTLKWKTEKLTNNSWRRDKWNYHHKYCKNFPGSTLYYNSFWLVDLLQVRLPLIFAILLGLKGNGNKNVYCLFGKIFQNAVYLPFTLSSKSVWFSKYFDQKSCCPPSWIFTYAETLQQGSRFTYKGTYMS